MHFLWVNFTGANAVDKCQKLIDNKSKRKKHVTEKDAESKDFLQNMHRFRMQMKAERTARLFRKLPILHSFNILFLYVAEEFSSPLDSLPGGWLVLSLQSQMHFMSEMSLMESIKHPQPQVLNADEYTVSVRWKEGVINEGARALCGCDVLFLTFASMQAHT